jgi:gas vesicle protein
MTGSHFLLGMGLGVLAGTALGMTMVPKKKKIRRAAEKAMHTASEAMEDLTDALGF